MILLNKDTDYLDEDFDILKEYTKLAKKSAGFLKDKDGNLLKTVFLKGEGAGFYWSPTESKLVLVPRKAEYYILPYKRDHKDRYYLFLPYYFTNGLIVCAEYEEIDFLGFN